MYFIFCLSLISFHIWLNVAVILSKYIEQDNYWIFIYHGSWFFRDETLFYPLEIIQGLLKNQKTGWTVVVAFTLCWYLTFLQVDMSFDFNSSYALCQLLSLLCSCLFFFLFPDAASSEFPIASCALLLGWVVLNFPQIFVPSFGNRAFGLKQSSLLLKEQLPNNCCLSISW